MVWGDTGSSTECRRAGRMSDFKKGLRLFRKRRSPRDHGLGRLFVLIVVTLLMAVLFLPAPSARASIQIASSGISKGVDTSTSEPIDTTQNFTTGDAGVYSWVEFVNVYPPSHNVTWVWLTPQRHVYTTSNATISDPGEGNYWPSLFYYSHVNVSGSIVAQLPGSWEVEVYVDGAVSLLQNFSISDAAPRVQPAGGWYWPVTTVDVYVQPQPEYAREDVVQAMGQWNYSQAWFQGSMAWPRDPRSSWWSRTTPRVLWWLRSTRRRRDPTRPTTGPRLRSIGPDLSRRCIAPSRSC